MKIDFSTILLVIVAIIPGLFAQRTRNQLVPRSFAPQGASAELAELAALGLATHAAIAFLVAAVLIPLGWVRKGDPDYFFSALDSLLASQWFSKHMIESCGIGFSYVLFSFFCSHWLGFTYGLMRLKSPVTTTLFAKANFLKKWFGVDGLLGERPIIYEVLSPSSVQGVSKSVFVEIEMKGSCGFYSGQVSEFAIVKDEEPHKPIYLIDIWFKKERGGEYEQVDTDGMMIDLADSISLQVRQVEIPDSADQPDPTPDEVAALAHKFWLEDGCKDGMAEQDWLRAEQQLRSGTLSRSADFK